MKMPESLPENMIAPCGINCFACYARFPKKKEPCPSCRAQDAEQIRKSCKTCKVRQETLADFIRVMPDVPFTENDIIIEFAQRSKLVECFAALCAVCCPSRVLNEAQKQSLSEVENQP